MRPGERAKPVSIEHVPTLLATGTKNFYRFGLYLLFVCLVATVAFLYFLLQISDRQLQLSIALGVSVAVTLTFAGLAFVISALMLLSNVLIRIAFALVGIEEATSHTREGDREGPTASTLERLNAMATRYQPLLTVLFAALVALATLGLFVIGFLSLL